MAHRSLKSGYERLVRRLNRAPQGAPPSALLYEILKILINEKEAALLSVLPIRPFTVKSAAHAWQLHPAQTRKLLDELCVRALLVDLKRDNERRYCLPPPMAGFFEFSLMRIRGDINQKMLAELYYQYINEEEDFIKHLFMEGRTQLGRVFVHEPVLTNENALHVLDYERATHVIETASDIGIGTCYCRHKMAHVGRDCDAPKEICMTFNITGKSLINSGFARKTEVAEAVEILHSAYEHNLVQFGENVREKVNFICNCCKCCCEGMITARKFAFVQPVHTTNFLPGIDDSQCNGCGKCARVCPVDAVTMKAQSLREREKNKTATINEAVCLGCGVCARVCPTGSITLHPRPQRVMTPLNTAHRTVLMAVERGKLQHLIFDNQIYKSHRALAAVMGVLLKLAPLKQAMAASQLQSRYVEALMKYAFDYDPA